MYRHIEDSHGGRVPQVRADDRHASLRPRLLRPRRRPRRARRGADLSRRVRVAGQPVVLPQLHARVGETLYLHGSSGARALREARGDGLEVCVTVTLVDGVVLARSAFNHSMNYRSVVVRGTAKVVTDEAEKQDALTALVDAIVPGRSAEVRGPKPQGARGHDGPPTAPA